MSDGWWLVAAAIVMWSVVLRARLRLLQATGPGGIAMATGRRDPFLLTAPLDEHGLYASRRLEDGRWLGVQPRTFGEVQLGITIAAHDDVGEALDQAGWQRAWTYASREDALVAMEFWDGISPAEPGGWKRRTF